MADTEPADEVFTPTIHAQDEDADVQPTPMTSFTATEPDTHDQALLSEDPFSSETSRILFNGMDRLRQCGQLLDLPLPQLLIVGAQSAGKSSLLEGLTDIPFRVGDGLCTRFATRVISRRSSDDIVNVKVIRPLSETNGDEILESWTLREITPESFDETFQRAALRMGISLNGEQGGPHFSTDVLEIELSGPNRSYFGILDIPGLFQVKIGGVTEEERKQVEQMIISYMRQPNNFVICVVPAYDDMATQPIIQLAYENAQSGVVGVFTKCDVLQKPEMTVSRAIDNIPSYAPTEGWFVVRNATNRDEREDRQILETALFKRNPWNRITETRRGTDELKRFLANQLATRMRDNFPICLRMIKHDLNSEEKKLKALGKARSTYEEQKAFLDNIAQDYKILATSALSNPVSLPSDKMKLRGKVQNAMREFGEEMRINGPKEKFINMNEVQDEQVENTPLYKEITNQMNVNRGEELPGITNPAVLRALFAFQTIPWQGLAQIYLDGVVDETALVAKEIFAHVSAPTKYDIPVSVKNQLSEMMQEFKDKALTEFQTKLRDFCEEHSRSPMATTDEGFERKVKEAQRARFIAALVKFRSKYTPDGIFRATLGDDVKKIPSTAMTTITAEWVIFESTRYDDFFHEIHPRMARNTKDELHDLLRAYYEINIEYFKTYVHDQIIEKFLHSDHGPLFGLTTYLKNLNKEQVEILGGEDPAAANRRKKLERKVEKLREALGYAEDTLRAMNRAVD